MQMPVRQVVTEATIKEHFDAYSAEARKVARTALISAFGTTPIGAITAIAGGASGASTFRVEAGDRRYLLRMEGPASPLRNPHQYLSLRIAADAGIAPRIHHIDEAARVAVMDFIEEQPLETYPGGPRALAQALGVLLKRVQETTPFPRFVEYPDIVAQLWDHVCRTGLFAPNLLDAHTKHLERIREVYVWDPQRSVSCHNDPTPRNILFDGERLWLVDWESAYRNDPLVDVAILLDNLVPSPELGDILLRAWLGRAPDETLCIRLALIRSLSRLYYAGVLLSASAAARWTTHDTSISALTAPELQLSIREGRLKRGAPETKHILGKMYLAAFLSSIAPPGLAAAV